MHSPQKACFFSPPGDSSGEFGIGSVSDPCVVAMVPALTAPVPTAEVALSPSDLTQWQSSSVQCVRPAQSLPAVGGDHGCLHGERGFRLPLEEDVANDCEK